MTEGIERRALGRLVGLGGAAVAFGVATAAIPRRAEAAILHSTDEIESRPPQFPTTDIASWNRRPLNQQTGERVSALDFGAVPDGTTDCAPALQSAVDHLIGKGGGTLYIPAGTYAIVANNPTAFSGTFTNPSPGNPKRVLVHSAANIHIEGIGRPTIVMAGLTRTQLDNAEDINSSGRDYFTVFSFINSSHCSVRGIRFEAGEPWDGSGHLPYVPGTAGAPRTKAIGFLGSSNCRVDDCEAYGLLGNLVNAAGADERVDQVDQDTPCTGIVVSNCFADHCYENGFNYMGNANECALLNSKATRCGSAGFESASVGLRVSNNTFAENRTAGISISGKDCVIDGNLITANKARGDGNTVGVGVLVTYWGQISSGNILFSNNIISDNDGWGAYIYAAPGHVQFRGNLFRDNGKVQTGLYGIYEIYSGGSPTLPTWDLVIEDNQFVGTIDLSDTSKLILLNNTLRPTIRGNKVTANARSAMFVYLGDNVSGGLVENNDTTARIIVGPNAKDVVVRDNINRTGNQYLSDPRIVPGAAVPTSGSWRLGDWVTNTSPDNGVMGWVCTRSGTSHSSTPWAASTGVTAANPYVKTTSGRVYRYLSGGLSGATAPTHTTGVALDGTAWLEYVGPAVSPLFRAVAVTGRRGEGVVTKSGDGSSTTLSIAHGLGSAPTWYTVQAGNAATAGAKISYVTATTSDLVVNFETAPTNGTNNLSLSWAASAG